MAADEPQRAPNVCANCKARKKRCDKAIPRCQFCVRHDLHCLYQAPSRPSAQAATVNRHPSNERAPFHVAGDRSPATNAGKDAIAASTQLLSNTSETAAESTLCDQARRLIRATGLYLDDISVRYFQGIHAFVPIVSRDTFHAHLISFGASPRAEFALLLVCMGLLAHYDPAADSSSSSPDESPHQGIAPDLTLYVAVKSLIAQAQALFTPSLHIIQAQVLLSVYEYTHGFPDKAFVSIGACARMAYAAGLPSPQLVSGCPTEDVSSYPTAAAAAVCSSEEREGIRTWWGILICERTFFCEQRTLTQPLGSVMPDKTCCLPPDSTCPVSSWNDQAPPAGLSSGSTIRDALEGPVPVSGFGGMALAASLLDDVLQSLAIPEPRRKLARLHECDKALQSLLAAIMQQCNRSKFGAYCGAIGLTIRTLYLLHWHLVDQGDQEPSSCLTLDSITNMVIDIAISHEPLAFSELDGLPPTCIYLFRAALKHVNRAQPATQSGHLLQESTRISHTARLQSALRRVENRWCTPRLVQ